MAKFSGKNIEFLDNQKAIFGSNDDSSIYWDPVDNELVVTTTFSGIDPVAPGHLVTLRFMEDELTTLSGILQGQIDSSVFGSEFAEGSSDGLSSTNSTSWQNKLSLSVSDIPAGKYRLSWAFDWRVSRLSGIFYVRIQQDDTTDILNKSSGIFSDVNIWNSLCGFYYLDSLSSGNYTFDLDFHSNSVLTTAYIQNVRLEFWRII